MNEQMNRALDFLRDKYGVPAGVIEAGTEAPQLRLPDGKTVKLLPWRVERRFVELKKIIDGGTLEDVSTFRFARFSAGGELAKLLEPELDLAAYLSGSAISGLFATEGGTGEACNVIFRLANGMSGCIECSVKLPAGTAPIDRHEVIARRGVASDRVVDTQVPQNSIYLWNGAGEQTYTDVDTELFGLANDEIYIVRAAFAVLARPELAAQWNEVAAAIAQQSQAALQSAASGKPVTFRG